MAELELDRVGMSYGNTRVLHDVSLQVPDGRFHAVVGPSGSGKTSALRLLAGFARPDAGQVRIGGHDVGALPPERRDLGIVFQNYALFPHMDIAGNVGFGLRMRGAGRAEIRRRTGEMLELVGLGGLGARYPDELSGGQQQRVALARALVIRPKALLLDEPLSALDRKIRQEMQLELRRIQREAGVTAVIVTHDQEEALSLGDRLTVLDAGRVCQEGPPFEVYNHPASVFVAGFLGNANLFAGRVRAAAEGRVALKGAEAVGLHLPPGTAEGAAVTLCIRPERWRLAADAEGPGLALAGPIRHLHQTGETGNGAIDTPLGPVAFTVLSPALGDLATGKPVTLHATPRDIQVL